MSYTFNPTSGIPLASYNYDGPPDSYKITWFSTIQPNSRTYCPNKGKNMDEIRNEDMAEAVELLELAAGEAPSVAPEVAPESEDVTTVFVQDEVYSDEEVI